MFVPSQSLIRARNHARRLTLERRLCAWRYTGLYLRRKKAMEGETTADGQPGTSPPSRRHTFRIASNHVATAHSHPLRPRAVVLLCLSHQKMFMLMTVVVGVGTMLKLSILTCCVSRYVLMA